MFDEFKKRLTAAQDSYTLACRALDAQLKAVVARDPKHLKAAKALQADYAIAPEPLALAAHEQPAAAPETKPKASKKK